MAEFRFYHLERRRIDQALPDHSRARAGAGPARVVVRARRRKRSRRSNDRLWTYADESFLPHGAARDGEPQAQPVYLTKATTTPTAPTMRVLCRGVEAAPSRQRAYERVIVLFDGRDEETNAEARRQWTLVKAAGAAPSYWREGEDGGWEKAR